MACSPLIQEVKAVLPRSAPICRFEIVGLVTTELQIGQLRKEVAFLVVPKLATNVILETGFIERYNGEVNPKTVLSKPRDSGTIAIIGETRRNHKINISVKNLDSGKPKSHI